MALKCDWCGADLTDAAKVLGYESAVIEVHGRAHHGEVLDELDRYLSFRASKEADVWAKDLLIKLQRSSRPVNFIRRIED